MGVYYLAVKLGGKYACLVILVLLTFAIFTPLVKQENASLSVIEDSIANPLSSEIGTPQMEWNFTIGSEIHGSPTLADLGGDDGLEILFGADDYKLYCLNSTGGLKWSYTCDFRLAGTPSVADVDNDGSPEILVGSNGLGKLFCISANGGLEWSFPTDGGISVAPCVANLDSDPELEILFGSLQDKFYCVDGYGDFEWDFNKKYIGASACVTNLDGSDFPVILIGEHEDYFYCLESYGYQRWSRNTGGTGVIKSSCFVANIDNQGNPEILVASIEPALYCLNSGGSVRWTYTGLDSPYCSTPTVAELDETEGLETIVCSSDEIHCVNSTGGIVWSYRTDAPIRSSQCIVDVDGDAELEILVGKGHFGINPGLLCLDSSGGLEWTIDTSNSVYSYPCAADIDGDNSIEVLFVTYDTYDDIGVVHCISVIDAPLQTSIYDWPSIGFMGDIGRTGCFEDDDSDQLTNNYEITAGSSSIHSDTDTDERSDYQEFLESTDPNLDLVVPNTVTDLTAVNSTSNSITLSWTAPGDNGASGTVSDYILRYSSVGPIDYDNWNDAIPYAEDWTPQPGGSIEVHEVIGLSESTTYWFALVAADESPNNSGVSNSPSFLTESAPPPTTMLVVVGIVLGVIALTIVFVMKRSR